MESRKQKQNLNSYPPSPLPNLPSSSIFKDVSNFKTPRNPSRISKFQSSPFSQKSQFFTASKTTPLTSSSRALKTSALKSKAARKLRAFELERLNSARKIQIEKEKSLKSLARALTVWLNFLLKNPKSCGCDPAKFTGEIEDSHCHRVGAEKESPVNNGKRESRPSHEVGVDGPWRCPKRQRELLWRGAGSVEKEESGFSDSMSLGLRASLREICSFEDLKDRMRMYLSLASCKEIFDTMTQVTKSIDEGRLKMRANCPIVSDVGMKEKAMKILMCYNPVWLRIGLYIILGGDSLLPNGDVNSEQEIAFLRMVIEKQFFSHTGLAKTYAYNKLVEGLYRPGYYEKLGNVILKRILLLVIIIDRAKSQTSLPIKYGIDGLDGGSPLLFSSKSNIKSSRQLISDFLSSDVMHGEGNLLAHLVIVGYKVSYQQSPLIEYDFRVTDLFEDLQDGVRLCRAIELLKQDPSILMKVIVPSDTQKKSLVNCGVALQYLKQAGVPLLDDDGMEIIGDDIVNGDKELTLSLMWNMFVHLQLPLLINRQLLSDEISNIRGVSVENSSTQTLLDLLLTWIQAICETYKFNVDSQSSLLDGKAMWCLLDYYFRKQHDCSCSLKDADGTKGEISIMSDIEYTDAVHNFILSQKLTSLLGNFPEVLQVSDILEHNGACNGQSDELNLHKLLGFSCQSPDSRRISAEWNDEQDNAKDFKAIMAWWQDMAQQNGRCNLKPAVFSAQCFLAGRKSSSKTQQENAATIIQSHFRRFVARQNYLKTVSAALVLQGVALACLSMKKNISMKELRTRSGQGPLSTWEEHFKKFGTCPTSMADRHYLANLRSFFKATQHATGACITQNHWDGSTLTFTTDFVNAATIIQSCVRGWIVRSTFDQIVSQKGKTSVPSQDVMSDLHKKAVITIHQYWKKFIFRKNNQSQHCAATKIQSCYRGWLMRMSFACKKQAVITIQRSFRCFRCRKHFQIQREENASAIILQSHARGWMARRKAYGEKQLIIQIQSYCRGWLQRKELIFQGDAARRIQSAFRCMKFRKAFLGKKYAAIDVQCFVRGENSRKRLLGASCYHYTPKDSRGYEFKIFLESVVKLQRWWRNVVKIKEEKNSALVIQSHFRGWIARQMAKREMQSVVVIQSYCRGWLQRKELLLQEDAARRIQSAFICMKLRKAFLAQKHATIEIQRFVRMETGRKRLLGAPCYPNTSKLVFLNLELEIFLQSIVKLQRWWRDVLNAREKTKAAVIVQSHFRGWIAREMAKREKQRVVVIQSYWKGYLARKDAKGQLLDLRLRMQKSAANVDDSMRLINRLVAALSELLSIRSVSGILHLCETLDVATKHSQRCCEELVAAGAVGTLLKLIRSVSRSIPDQQVLKHALSTLRNLSRYPHLTEKLVESYSCVEVILWEFLRNKEEGYFIASELLHGICRSEKGIKAIHNLPALLKRLNNLVAELARKTAYDKRCRNPQNLVAREHTERRLKEAVELLELITNS